MRSTIRIGVLAVTAVVAATSAMACGGSPTGPDVALTGTWTARGPGHTGMVFVIRLRSVGDTISGVACSSDGGINLFRDAPVHGRYPNVGFTVTPESAGACCPQAAGMRFSGRQDGTGDIVGTVQPGGLDLRFDRATSTSGC